VIFTGIASTAPLYFDNEVEKESFFNNDYTQLRVKFAENNQIFHLEQQNKRKDCPK